MTTVREGLVRYYQFRADGLKEHQAPDIMIEFAQKTADEIAEGTSKMKGLTEYGELAVVDSEVRTGRGGRQYHRLITDRDGEDFIVLFFPNAKYGAFLTEEQKS